MTSPNTSAQAIIAQAKKLLAEGKKDEPHDLLLDEGYVLRSNPEIQRAFLKLIPIRPTLRMILDERYRGIDDPDPQVRFKSLASINRELCRQTLRNNVFWMRDPRASDPIIKAFSDQNRKVSDRAWITVAHLMNYFPDMRVLPMTLARLKDRKQSNRCSAMGIISALRNEDLLLHLVDLFDQGTEDDRAMVIRYVWGHFLPESTLKALRPFLPVIRWSKSGRELWEGKLIKALAEEKLDTRIQAVHGLRALGEADSLPALQAARLREQDANAAYHLEEAIKDIKSGKPWVGS